jgi:FixJ family two-component response regulator
MDPHRPLVAFVDNDESMRRAVTRLFRSTPYDSATFDCAESFIESLWSRVPRCVILDLQMPDLTGIELQLRLRDMGYRFPYIVVTAQDEPGSRERCLAAGARFYFRKPVEAEELISAVATVIGRVAD